MLFNEFKIIIFLVFKLYLIKMCSIKSSEKFSLTWQKFVFFKPKKSELLKSEEISKILESEFKFNK